MGAGLWIGGRVHEGAQALAGGVGHIRLAGDGPVGFGKRGSVEGFCSGPGLVQLAFAERTRLVQLGKVTRLSEVGSLDAEIVCGLAAGGDEGAIHAVTRSGEAVGELCAMLVDLLNPDVIVLGTIGTACGEAGVNIAAAQVGRKTGGGEAIMALALDAPLTHDVLVAITSSIGAHEGRAISLP